MNVKFPDYMSYPKYFTPYKWFDKIRKDDAAEFHAKYAQRQTAKAK